jgi:drug/metabolite transporter (DMT)-like permease
LRGADLARLVTLAAMWGASYLFMRYAVPHFGPVLMITVRVLVAGLALFALVAVRGARVDWRKHWRAYLFVAVIGLDVPFLLIAQAVTTIDASTAAILNALAPLFAALFAAWWIRDRLTIAKLSGIALCLAGTALLVGWRPSPMSANELIAASFSVIATALYGYTMVFTKVYLKGANAMAISAATLLLAAGALMPIAPLQGRDLAAIPLTPWLAVLGLAFISTTVAFVFYYRLIADVGPVKASTVTLLVPVFGMIWGVLFLGEPVTPGRIAGCAIILSGCALILGLVGKNGGSGRMSTPHAQPPRVRDQPVPPAARGESGRLVSVEPGSARGSAQDR